MKIIPYKQNIGESCLVACFLMLLRAKRNLEFEPILEQELLFEGLKECRDYYVVGISKVLYRAFHFPFSIYVDNKWFTKKIKIYLKKENIPIYHQKINLNLINHFLKMGKMPIVYVDSYSIGTNYHTPHFVIVENKRKKYAIIDPWFGKRKYFSKRQLLNAIMSLRNRLFKYCPLIIVLI